MTRTDSNTGSGQRPPIIWCIAGSDSGGGAGIQADIPTIHALGGHPATALTAVTAQNSLGVQAVSAVAPTLFQQQLDSLAADLPPAALKIGLLAEPEQIDVLCTRLPEWKRRWPALKVVLDPVMIATSGDTLASEEVARALRCLLPWVDILTPNLPELAALTDTAEADLQTLKAARRATWSLLQQGCRSVVVKGGHVQWLDDSGATTCVDALFTQDDSWTLVQPRVDTPHTHGTGCSLSSALATALATGHPPEDALVLANTHIHQGLQNAYATGSGAGTLRRWSPATPDALARCAPTLLTQASDNASSGDFLRCLWEPLGLYPVVPDSHWLARVLKAGVRTVQLRIKSANKATLTAEIKAAVALGQRHGAQVFINDHWALALELNAFGVHLGQEDLADADLSALQASGVRLGISTHGYAELLRALALRPSYVALGHVFPTQTKAMPSQPQGLRRLADYQAMAAQAGIASVAIGGIKPHHLPAIRRCGVHSVAMVTAITHAADPEAVIAQCQQALLEQPQMLRPAASSCTEEIYP